MNAPIIRKFFALISAVIVAVSILSHAHAGNTAMRQLFITDFNVAEFNGINTGIFYGAVYDSDDHFSPIMLTLYDESATTHEDMLSFETYITGTFELNEDGADTDIVRIFSKEYNRVLTFAWRYLDDGSIGTLANVHMSDTNPALYFASLNGESVQVFGYVNNGTAYVLRDAKATACTVGCRGYLLQHGAIIQYAATDNEYRNMPVYIPIVAR